jgi:hypothetical protein
MPETYLKNFTRTVLAAVHVLSNVYWVHTRFLLGHTPKYECRNVYRIGQEQNFCNSAVDTSRNFLENHRLGSAFFSAKGPAI